jgi:cysteine desulfurase
MAYGYLDWASTSPIEQQTIEELSAAQQHLFGNASSLHSYGKEAASGLTAARSRCAEAVGTSPSRIYFTSGGTEANSLILLSLLRTGRRGRILLSSIEHPSIFEYGSILREAGFEVTEIPADGTGHILPERVEELIDERTRMVAVMTVNNETGAVQDLPSICEAVRRRERELETRIHLHTDAVQALGKIPLRLDAWAIDSAAFSSHKIAGPKGVGMLYLASDFSPAVVGGGQEGGYRPGTENVPAVTAFAGAAERRDEQLERSYSHAAGLKRLLIESLQRLEDVRILPREASQPPSSEPTGAAYSPYILSFSAAPLPGEVLVRVLNDRGFAVSTGSACSSRKREKRHRVLRAMGISGEEAAGAVRVSIGWSTTEEEITSFCATLESEISALIKTVR